MSTTLINKKYTPNTYQRLGPHPLDSCSVISSLSRLDIEIPVGIRYPGEMFYTQDSDDFYYFRLDEGDWYAVKLNIDGKDFDTIYWNIHNTDDAEYFNYTGLRNTIKNIFQNSLKNDGSMRICHVFPLDIDIYVGIGENNEIFVATDYNAHHIYFNKIDFSSIIDNSQTYGPEVASFLSESYPLVKDQESGMVLSNTPLLPYNADIYYSSAIESGETITEKSYRINYDMIVDYVPDITGKSSFDNKFIAGRMYLDGGRYKMCTGSSRESTSLITFGNTSRLTPRITITNLRASKCYEHSRFQDFGIAEEENAVSMSGANSVCDVFLLYYDSILKKYSSLRLEFFNDKNNVYIKSRKAIDNATIVLFSMDSNFSSAFNNDFDI